MEPSLTLSWSDWRYFTSAGRIYFATNVGFNGHIKLNEHADILFIYKSQCLNFW